MTRGKKPLRRYASVEEGTATVDLADVVPDPECDLLDDVQDHHDWDYEKHGKPFGICRRCGTLSQGWEE